MDGWKGTPKGNTVIRTGLENLIQSPPAGLAGRRLGLLCNPASVDRHFQHARTLIDRCFPGQLTALFSPQHGFFAEKQDNMIESGHLEDPLLKIPVFSLYGDTRIPTRDMFEPIDVLLIDLQDAGTRVYTFIYTMSYCLEAARSLGKRVVVLDRPNPLGGLVMEGNLLEEDLRSFVGRFPIPMRHGLTIGELALLFNETGDIGCDLEVVPLQGWQRAMLFGDTGLPWVAPSPNLPTPAAALVYPGQVLWEGTNVSEGRGTTQPFELFGAPFVDPDRILSSIHPETIPGICLRPTAFEPVAGKWHGQCCHGFQLHVTDRAACRPYTTSLALLQAVRLHHKDRFAWKHPPYEYEYEKRPIDLIIGSRKVRRRLERLDPIDQIAKSWQPDLQNFAENARRFQLYT